MASVVVGLYWTIAVGFLFLYEGMVAARGYWAWRATKQYDRDDVVLSSSVLGLFAAPCAAALWPLSSFMGFVVLCCWCWDHQPWKQAEGKK